MIRFELRQKQFNDSIELFIPNRLNDCNLALNWAKERDCFILRVFNPHSNYPDGVRDTTWKNIVWSFRIYLS